MTTPPSIITDCPVMWSESGPARYDTKPTTSSGVCTRPRGMSWEYLARACLAPGGAELVRHPLDEREDGVPVGDVGGHGERAATGRGDLGGDGLGDRRVHVVGGHRVPVAGQPQRDGPADPAAGAGDDRGRHPRSCGETRIFTFSSLWSISSRKPPSTSASRPIFPVMNGAASTLPSRSSAMVSEWSPQ